MAANTMNFGPEWMRPAKPANGAAAPTGVLAGPSRDHPAFKAGALQMRPRPSNGSEDASVNYAVTTTPTASTATFNLSAFADEPKEVKFAPPLDPLMPAPFRYTTEFMLSLFNADVPVPELDFERHEVVLSEETLPPVVTLHLTELEENIMASGTVNSDVARRIMQGGRGGRGGSRGGRGGSRGGFNSRNGSSNGSGLGNDEGFRNFMSRVQVTDEPAWNTNGSNNSSAALGGRGSIGHYDAQGVFHFENVEGGRGGHREGHGGHRGGRLPDLATVAAEFSIVQQAQQLAAAAAVAQLQENPEETLWLYRDPQGNIQGPFTGLDMHEWYKAGFFTSSLMVKREGDAEFTGLGHLVQVLGNDEMPFLMPAPLRLSAQGAQSPGAGVETYGVLESTSTWTATEEDAYLRELEMEKDRVRQQMDRQRLVHVLQQRQNVPVNQAATPSGQHISRGYQSDLLAKLNQQDDQVDQLGAGVSQLDVNGQ